MTKTITTPAEDIRAWDEERAEIAERAKKLTDTQILELAKANSEVWKAAAEVRKYEEELLDLPKDAGYRKEEGIIELREMWKVKRTRTEQFYFCLLAGLLDCRVLETHQMEGVYDAHRWIKKHTDMLKLTRKLAEE